MTYDEMWNQSVHWIEKDLTCFYHFWGHFLSDVHPGRSDLNTLYYRAGPQGLFLIKLYMVCAS